MNVLKCLCICIFMGLSVSASANDFSCRDIRELRNDLEVLANEIEFTSRVTRRDAEDLADLVEIIYVVADSERNRALYNAASGMERAFQRENKEAYVDYLDDVTDELDDIYHYEC